MRYELRNVYITAYNTSGSSTAPTLPMEDFTIAYTPIEVSYSRGGFDFTNGDDGVEKPKFEWIEIKAPPKPPSDSSAVFDELILEETPDPDPLAGLLLPAVQSVREPSTLPPDEATFLDDFIFA